MPEIRTGVLALVPGFLVEFPAAVICGIDIVVGNPLAPEVVEGTLHDTRNHRRAGLMAGISERLAAVLIRHL